MEWNTLLAMIGSGGLVGFVNWLINLKVSRQKARMDKDDVSRHMAARDNETIIELYDKNRDILERLVALEEALYKLVRCKHYDTCPARNKLQEYKESYRYQRNRQSPMEQKGVRYPRDNPVKPGDAPDSAGQPP